MVDDAVGADRRIAPGIALYDHHHLRTKLTLVTVAGNEYRVRGPQGIHHILVAVQPVLQLGHRHFAIS